MNTALQWRGTDDTRYIAYLMAESAGKLRALHGAAREIPQYHSSHAAPMLLAFAMERALKAWQGESFLISLKAGGVGQSGIS